MDDKLNNLFEGDDPIDQAFQETMARVTERIKDDLPTVKISLSLDHFLGQDRDIDPKGKQNIVSIARAVQEGTAFDQEVMDEVLGNPEYSFLLPAFLVALGMSPDVIPRWTVTVSDEETNKRSIEAFRYAQNLMRDYTRFKPDVQWCWLEHALSGFKLENLKPEKDLKVFLAMSHPTMMMEAATQYSRQRYAPYLEAFALALYLNYEGFFTVESLYQQSRLKPARLIINDTAYENGRLTNYSRAVQPLPFVLAQPVQVKGQPTATKPVILTDEFWQVVEDFRLPITPEIREIGWPRYFYI